MLADATVTIGLLFVRCKYVIFYTELSLFGESMAICYKCYIAHEI